MDENNKTIEVAYKIIKSSTKNNKNNARIENTVANNGNNNAALVSTKTKASTI